MLLFDHNEFYRWLYDKQYKKLYAAAYKVLHDHYMAEEAVQNTIEVSWVKRIAFFTSNNRLGWLYETLKHEIKKIQHDPFVKRVAEYTETIHGQSLETEQTLALLYGNITDNPDFKIVNLHYIEKLSYKEIAKKLDMNINSIGPTINRAKEKLKELFEDEK